jgi:hypothetical protein
MQDVDDKYQTHHPARKFMRQFFGTITMMVSSSQILNAYVCEPDSLAKSYLSFLITHGGIRALQPKRSRQYLNTMGHTIKETIQFGSKYVSNAKSFRESLPVGMDPTALEPFKDFISQAPNQLILCSVQHPVTSSCYFGAINAFMGEWGRAFRLYAPLNLFMAIIFKGKSLLKDPRLSARKIILSTLRSVLFLSLYVTSAWSLPCFFRNLAGYESKWMYYVNGLVAGSMVLIEQPGRRLELGMYCLPRAVESLWNSMVNRGIVKNIR